MISPCLFFVPLKLITFILLPTLDKHPKTWYNIVEERSRQALNDTDIQAEGGGLFSKGNASFVTIQSLVYGILYGNGDLTVWL
jgi:hypothetical protein